MRSFTQYLTEAKTEWVVRFLDEYGEDVVETFSGTRGFMAARQLHALLKVRTDLTDLEIFSRTVK